MGEAFVASWLLLTAIACGKPDEPTDGETTSDSTAAASGSGATTMTTTSSGGSTTAEASGSDSPGLPPCSGVAEICYEQPLGTICECPPGLTCVGDALGHVRDCQACDCEPDETCVSDAAGGYYCVPDMSSGDSSATTTGDATSTTSG